MLQTTVDSLLEDCAARDLRDRRAVLVTRATISYFGGRACDRTRMSERLARYVPITQWLPRYERSFLGARPARRPRRLGGARARRPSPTPRSPARRPQAGLFAALAAGVAYAVFGTCRELDVGPSSTIAITAAAALAPVAATFPAQEYTALLAALALLTGVVLVAAGAAAARVRVRVPRPAGARRLHQRDRRS